jgi:2-methylcitrate dehydratase PrpD
MDRQESSPSPSALVLLADEASRLTLARCPDVVKRQAQLCILDTAGCILAGSRTEEAAMMLQCEPSDADAATAATATVYGTAQRRSVAGAIRLNGYFGDVLELNDLIGGHASIGIVTASLALAEARGSSGAALLEAVIRGIEVTSRVYDAVYPSLRRFTDVALVPVGIPSSIGAAAAAARLLELDSGTTRQAMAIAGALAGWCPAEVIFGNGGTVKPMLFGAQPGTCGVSAAMYAQAGMTGPLGLLDSGLGYFTTVSTAGALDTSPWSDRWSLARPRRKLHACCGYLHSALDAATALRRRVGAAVVDGATLEVHVPAYTADVVSKPRAPVSPTDARFHLQYCLALALTGTEVIAPEHSIDFVEHLARPEVAAAMRRIGAVVDPSLTHYHQSRLVLRERGAVIAEQATSAPRGSPSEPLADAEVVDKFLRLAAPVLTPARAASFVQRLDGLDAMASVAPWLQHLARAATPTTTGDIR